MNKHTTLLLTAPPAGLLADIARKRPGWEIVPLEELPPSGPLDGRVWGFIDWLCPTMSGLELCRRLRETEATRDAHLTLVLDEPSQEARRRALQAGADDYLIGPLDVTRLLERIDSVADEPAPQRRQLVNGAISLDPTAHQVRVHGAPVAMRPNEFRLLLHFMEHPDQVFSRTALIDRLGKDDEAIDDRTVDVWIGRLRRALIASGAPDPLRTVRSLGYVMDSVEG
ncbi:response regulator transcription factor [Novosphingobium sp.]|uniref:response regulator transcription factor n=1 Tax=Novosphingobium sp. TaxID=1874826 RepID=UPI0025E716FD|nr:response regulator transcription factor [Novosphingobium sp.]MCC6925348.1 winged helix-turn-helix domain-containing protein [Novosphingobium sp.]